MKHCNLMLILTFILLPGHKAKSQNYVPFPTSGVNWTVYLLTTCKETPPDTFVLRYAIHGDTSINGMTYRKLCLESGDIHHPDVEPIGGIREDAKKIYFTGEDFLGSPHQDELVLYDFNKQIGDTIQHDAHGQFYSVITDIDSVQIGNEYRKRYKVDNNSNHNPDYFIEGIGSVGAGLLGHITITPSCGQHYWEHICYKEDNSVEYMNPAFPDCYSKKLANSIKEFTGSLEIRMYPNPAANQITIESGEGMAELRLKIFDVTGRVILDERLVDAKETFILLVSAGIYYAVVSDKEGVTLMNETIIKK